MEERPAQTADQSSLSAERLEVCEECTSELVQPQDWAALDGGSWSVTLICPNCLHERSGTFDGAVVDAFDATLDDGYTTVLRSLQEIVVANLNAEIDVFVAALRVDAILPEDF